MTTHTTSTPGDALGLDITSDPPLDTPFLQHVGTISRPSSFTARTTNPLSGSNDGYSSSSGGSSRRSLDIMAQASAGGAPGHLNPTNKHVSWFDSGFDASAALKGSLSVMHGTMSSAQPAGNCHAGLYSYSNSALTSVHSAPVGWGTTGDLRDQGRISSAGTQGLGNGSVGNGAWLASGGGCDVGEETGTPMQAISTECLNSLLGGLSTSLFCDSLASTPLARTAATAATAAATAATAANKPLAPVLPDFIEARESSTGASLGALHGSTVTRRRDSSTGGSAFASANGAASAAAAAARSFKTPPFNYKTPVSTDSVDLTSPFQASFGDFLGPHHAAGFNTHTLGQSFSGPVAQFAASASNSFSNGGNATWAHGSTMPRSHQDLAAAAAAAAGSAAGYANAQAYSRLQRTSSAGGAMSAHLAAAAAAAAALAPTYSNPYHTGLTNYAAGALCSYPHPMMTHHDMMSAALHGMASCPVPPTAAYGNPALAAMLAAAYSQNSFAGNPASIYEAMAVAQLNNALNSSFNLEHQTSPLADSSNGSWGSPPGGNFPFPATDNHPTQWRTGPPACRKFQGPNNSKVDPKSMCGVDPRLCVGSPADVEFEVCRRNPGLAELLALQPRSVKLNNVAVAQDTLPPEMLASKREEGPITLDELTIESGLLRHCFGLPSSIGPDLVRAARHAVTRGDEPGGGLEPFFWVLQHKLNWLLKRPVFFKGQLLRGEIHAITDQQRAQSFAQVTEQRSKLGELLLVLFSMLKPESSSPSA